MSSVVTADSAVIVTQDAVEVVVVQAPGPAGPDPRDEPVQDLTVSGGTLEIDYSLGSYVILRITGNITSLKVTNWPISGQQGKLTIDVRNSGNYDIASYITDTGLVAWPDGLPPALTASGDDMLMLTTVDAGTIVKGHIIGQNYAEP